jgi:hypothetical protein
MLGRDVVKRFANSDEGDLDERRNRAPIQWEL